MSCAHRRSSGHDRSPFAARLRLLADLLAEGITDAPRLAVGVVDARTDLELLTWPLTTDDPVRELATVDAPGSWRAFGVATGGTARLPSEPDRPHEPVRVVVLVDRSGQVTSAITGHRALLDTGAEERAPGPLDHGRVPDACRRVLGLPTAPPPLPPTDLLVLRWLDALTAAGLARPGAVTWAQAEALLPEATGASWGELRRQTMRGEAVVEGIDASLASWMDDGMFAREALGHFAPVELLLSLLGETLPSATWARTLATLDSLATWGGAAHDRS